MGKPRALNIEIVQNESQGTNRLQAATSDGPRYEGKVESWKDAWGWITCPQLESNVFGHREDILNGHVGTTLAVGAALTFELGTDQKSGKPRALNIEVLQDGRLTGVLTSWRNLWGWITCPQVPDGDVFAHKEDMPNGAFIETGMQVSFELGEDEKGRRRAKAIVPMGPAKGCAGGKGCVKGGMPMPGQWPMPVPMPMAGIPGPMMSCGSYGKGMGCMPQGPGPATFVGQRIEGQINFWRDRQGLISSPFFAGELSAHGENVKGNHIPQAGMPVSFIVGTDSKGRLRALEIQLFTPGGGSVKRHAIADGKGSKGKLAGADFAQYEGCCLEGRVASWRSPWGWITTANVSGDIFAHKDDVDTGEELTPGQVVTFTVSLDQKSGRWRARNINTGGQPIKRIRHSL